MSRPIPISPKEVADGIDTLLDLHLGAFAGARIKYDWGALSDGVRDYIREHLQEPLPIDIEKVCDSPEVAETLVANFPALVQRIQSSEFPLGSLGSFLKIQTHNVEYSGE